MILPLTFLGGVFYSVDRLGSPWEQLSHANPLFYVVDAVRYGFLGTSDVGAAHLVRGAGRDGAGAAGLVAVPVHERAEAEALKIGRCSPSSTSICSFSQSMTSIHPEE